MYQLSTIERVDQKLKVMLFMETFDESYRSAVPEVEALTKACTTVRNSKKLFKVLEVILALGNVMNSSKRGGAWGFKMSILERVCEELFLFLFFFVNILIIF